MISKKGYIVIAAIIATMIADFLIIYFIDNSDPLDLLMRLCGLYGYFGISVSTIMTPFLTEIKRTFGKAFIEVHHVTAAIGIGCITAHPVIMVIEEADASIFLPVLSSWTGFWTWAGAPALILLYVAFVAVLVRKQIKKYWRYFHALMYAVLLFGIIHANLIQGDFPYSPILVAIYDILFIIVAVTFFLKRWQKYIARKNKAISAPASGT
nr:hypothetical protein [Candidatus Sigynarchaeota archaeon]